MLADLRLRIGRLAAELPATYWFLWLGTIVNRVGGFVTPFLTLYLTGERGVSVAEAAFVVSLFGVGQFAASLGGGMLSDRFGRRPVLLVSFFVGPTVMIILGLLRSYWAIAPCTLLLGFFTNLYRPAMSAAVADLVPAERRIRAYGYIYWAINLGAAIAPVIAGFMARADYLLLFLGDAASTLAFAVIVALRVPETRPPHPTAGADPGSPAGAPHAGRSRFAEIKREPLLLLFTALSFLTSSVYAQSYSTLPVAMRASGFGPSQYGLAIALNGILIVLLGIPAARITERLPRFATMAVAALLTGIGFGLGRFADSLFTYGLSVAIWTLGEVTASSVAPAIVSDLAPPHLRGLYQGVYGSSWGLSWFAGPIIGGLVYEHAGSSALWSGCFALCVVGAVGYVAMSRAARRRFAAR